MLTDRQRGARATLPIPLSHAHNAANGAHLAADLLQLALDADDGPDGDGPQVRDVEGAADAEPQPEPGARHQTQRERRA